MTNYYIGFDVGSTKTHALIATEAGQIAGFGEGGPGNFEVVGYDGLEIALRTSLDGALDAASLKSDEISGAGFGISGYDWASQRASHLEVIARLGLNVPVELVNDTILGLEAGSSEGWGIGVVSGTGCNCWGWNRDHSREGRVTGMGIMAGEGAGASEMMFRAMQLVNHAWIKRGQPTALSDAFINYAGAKNLEDLIEGYTSGRYDVGAAAARIVFEVARAGDRVAQDLVHWAGTELGEMVNAVARQLSFADIPFEVVMIGSMFNNGEMLIAPMRKTVHALAPGAQFKHLAAPPAIGAVLLGMEAAGVSPSAGVRQALCKTIAQRDKAR